MSVYAYVRVSTERQAEDGASLDLQQRQIAGYAQMLDLAIEYTFVERGISGSRPLADRAAGAKLLARVRAGDTIIAAKLDRLFRSALDALSVLKDLNARGIALHFIDLGGNVTGNGIAKLVFTILSAVAEAERDRIRERIADVKRDQRSRGRYLGGTVPFGYRVGENGELVEIPEQQEAIRTMSPSR
jgi:putative DNA-invertase from lambdoid prophage Rac